MFWDIRLVATLLPILYGLVAVAYAHVFFRNEPWARRVAPRALLTTLGVHVFYMALLALHLRRVPARVVVIAPDAGAPWLDPHRRIRIGRWRSRGWRSAAGGRRPPPPLAGPQCVQPHWVAPVRGAQVEPWPLFPALRCPPTLLDSSRSTTLGSERRARGL